MTDYHADLLTNLLSIALTLAAPRVWILLRAFVFWIKDKFISWKYRTQQLGRGRSAHDDACGDVPLGDLPGRNLTITANSHSEVSAAKDILQEYIRGLRHGRVALPTDPGVCDTAHTTKRRRLVRTMLCCLCCSRCSWLVSSSLNPQVL